MQDRPDGQAVSTVVANSSVAEERTVGTRQPVIVNRGHNRNPRIAASIEHSRAEQRKRVVDVDDLGAVLAYGEPSAITPQAAITRLNRAGNTIAFGAPKLLPAAVTVTIPAS